jgi:preprotein translocase subunit SecE
MSEERTTGDEARHDPTPPAEKPSKSRTGPAQFTREVRGELKRVNWPNRREVTSYSIVVLVAVSLLTAYIFGIDQAFGAFVFQIFG